MSRADPDMASVAKILLGDVLESKWANANVAYFMVLKRQTFSQPTWPLSSQVLMTG
jgi:hypothetical protein